jgi:hypothetical protein
MHTSRRHSRSKARGESLPKGRVWVVRVMGGWDWVKGHLLLAVELSILQHLLLKFLEYDFVRLDCSRYGAVEVI